MVQAHFISYLVIPAISYLQPLYIFQFIGFIFSYLFHFVSFFFFHEYNNNIIRILYAYCSPYLAQCFFSAHYIDKILLSHAFINFKLPLSPHIHAHILISVLITLPWLSYNILIVLSFYFYSSVSVSSHFCSIIYIYIYHNIYKG